MPTDPWASTPAPVPYRLFGRGSRHPFSYYFEGVSSVTVSDLDELERWLHGCMYVSDEQLFGRADHWQHPGEFEQIRMGDCDDHALWAWRKLVELGLPTDFVSGSWEEEPGDLHTWLLTTVDGRRHIVEATSKTTGETIVPFEAEAGAYRPYFSVDQRFRTRAYMGGLQELFRLELPGL